MAQKILVSKAGKNALTSTTPDDFYLHSDYPLLKVFASGTFTITPPSILKTITHNLGYKPFVIVFSQFVNADGSVTDEYYQHDWDILLGSEVFGYTYSKVNTIEIRVGGPIDAARNVEGFYFIFYDQVSS